MTWLELNAHIAEQSIPQTEMNAQIAELTLRKFFSLKCPQIKQLIKLRYQLLAFKRKSINCYLVLILEFIIYNLI